MSITSRFSARRDDSKDESTVRLTAFAEASAAEKADATSEPAGRATFVAIIARGSGPAASPTMRSASPYPGDVSMNVMPRSSAARTSLIASFSVGRPKSPGARMP